LSFVVQTQGFDGRTKLAKQLNIPDSGAARQPLLLEVLKRAQGGQSTTNRVPGVEVGCLLII